MRYSPWQYAAAVAVLAALPFAAPPAVAAPCVPEDEAVDFAKEIRPVLSRACFACHGPDEGAREAKLRLDLRPSAVADLGGYSAIVPGDAQASELVLRITDESDRMPPEDSGFELSEEEIALITQWIEQDAPYKEHWAFVAPEEQAPPAQAAGTWGRNAVDAFILAGLNEAGLAPSRPADRRTLIRRVTLDLTGLPPTLEELRAFVADDSADAFEQIVERLLASTRYGEHMARFWLDTARYGDTHGLHLDNYREMWPYRDQVIAAFNANQPYDQFVIEQLAGDMLPDATLEQQIASGFNRCNITTSEGGSIAEEVYVRNVVDRVSTTGTAFMGLTLGCAVCHNHKFDPFSQGEFYSLFAFFNNVEMNPLDGNAKNHAPVVRVPTPEVTLRIEELRAEREAAEEDINVALAAFVYTEPQIVARPELGERVETIWVDDAFPPGAKPEGDGLVWIEKPRKNVHSGRRAMERVSTGRQQHYFSNADTKLRVGAGDTLFAWVRTDPDNPPKQLMLQFNGDGDADWDHRAYWGADRINWGKPNTSSRRAMGELPEPGVWTRLAVQAEEIGFHEGDIIHGAAFTQFDGRAWWDTLGIASQLPQEAQEYVWIDDEAPEGAKLGGNAPTWNWVEGPEAPVLSGERSLHRSAQGLSQDVLTAAGPLVLRRGDRLFANVWLDPADPPKSIQLQFNDGNWEHRVRWGAPAHGPDRKGGADFVAGPIPQAGEWVRLEVDITDVGLAPGAHINGWAFTLVDGSVWWDRAGVKSWGQQDERHLQSQLAWEQRSSADDALVAPVKEALAVASDERNGQQLAVLREHYLRNVYAGTRDLMAPLQKRVDAAAKSIKDAQNSIPTTLVMRERKKPKVAYTLIRGAYDNHGEERARSIPAILPPMDPALPKDRLGFARWLVTPGHPLTSRVAVNRLWQQIFGVGLVRTSEDFGNQGELPSHPELLDWLALTFEDDWDIKGLMRLFVTSASYRQSSTIRPELLQKDPENRLLARAPRHRLDAETIRDQALALSGLLVEKIGGPGVKPPQPAGLWKVVAYGGSNTKIFVADKEPEKVHRRSLYTFFKRTAPPPQMSTFDAPNRESCITRRERTNTPLQALLLMNDPQFVEAARHLARRAMNSGGTKARERAAWMFELCTSRIPAPADVQDMLGLYREQLAEYRAHPDAAMQLISVGALDPDTEQDPLQLAAWTVVANLILNLDEVLVKG